MIVAGPGMRGPFSVADLPARPVVAACPCHGDAPTSDQLRYAAGCCEGWVCPTLDRLRRLDRKRRDAVARIDAMKATKRAKVAA